MNTRTLIIAGLVLLAVGYATGRMTTKAKVEIQTVTQIKEVEKQTVAQNTHQKVIEQVNKDGSKTITTTTDTSTDTSTVARTNTNTDTKSTTTYAQPDVILGIGAMVNILHPSQGYSPGVFAVIPAPLGFKIQGAGYLNGTVTVGIGHSF